MSQPTLDPAFFTEEAAVLNLIKRLKDDNGGKQFSDVIDDVGNQYIDLVLQGSGVLGTALIGYVHVLEQAGIRFLRIGGTSAGALVGLLLASVGAPQEAKCERVLSQFTTKNLEDFLDGENDSRELIATLLREPSEFPALQKLSPFFYKIFKGFQVLDELKEHLGLNPGNNFLTWLTTCLEQHGIHTARELRQRMAAPASLRSRAGEPLPDWMSQTLLAIVAADVTTQTKVEFPKMAKLYWKNADDVNPAYFVRASMSVPFFFHPYKVAGVPRGRAAREHWLNLARYQGNIPNECLFIDGGIMSNFPINLFHRQDVVPLAPTFGARLETDRMNPVKIETPLELITAIFEAARQTMDQEFVNRNPDYQKLITNIDTGEHHWLDFGLTDDDKKELFIDGAQAAYNFLVGFDWPKYKQIREGIAKATIASRT